MSKEADKIMVTDMGIATNLPFPAALRPERGIEMFLVFDWSSKKCDSEHPFRVRQLGLQFKTRLMIYIIDIIFSGYSKQKNGPIHMPSPSQTFQTKSNNMRQVIQYLTDLCSVGIARHAAFKDFMQWKCLYKNYNVYI